MRSGYFCRMVRSIVNSVVLWLLILLGLQLWSISIALACSLIWTTYFLFARGTVVVAELRPSAAVAKINWPSQVFPARWRLALSKSRNITGELKLLLPWSNAHKSALGAGGSA